MQPIIAAMPHRPISNGYNKNTIHLMQHFLSLNVGSQAHAQIPKGQTKTANKINANSPNTIGKIVKHMVSITTKRVCSKTFGKNITQPALNEKYLRLTLVFGTLFISSKLLYSPISAIATFFYTGLYQTIFHNRNRIPSHICMKQSHNRLFSTPKYGILDIFYNAVFPCQRLLRNYILLNEKPGNTLNSSNAEPRHILMTIWLFLNLYRIAHCSQEMHKLSNLDFSVEILVFKAFRFSIQFSWEVSYKLLLTYQKVICNLNTCIGCFKMNQIFVIHKLHSITDKIYVSIRQKNRVQILIIRKPSIIIGVMDSYNSYQAI